MRGRYRGLILAGLGALLFPGTARAHRLEAEAVIRPHRQIQVESWFETGETPRSAKVAVYREDGKVLAAGRLDKNGIFVFSCQTVEPLQVVVDAGAGHRVETAITAEQLTRYDLSTCVACLSGAPFLAASLLVPIHGAGKPPAPQPIVQRETGMQLRNLLIGVGILLGVALAALQWQRMRSRARLS